MTTVVLVIKPPGSDIEFEIKGRRKATILERGLARNGYTVPPSHRLDAVHAGAVEYEASKRNQLGTIFVRASEEAPCANYIARSTIYSVRSECRGRTLDYFTEPQFFGDRFVRCELPMKESVDAFVRKTARALMVLKLGAYRTIYRPDCAGARQSCVDELFSLISWRLPVRQRA